MTAPALPAFAAGLCDDAAMFPPGLMPLPDAVAAHRLHRTASYAELVGPLVLAAPALDALAPLLAGDAPPLDLSVTAPGGPAQIPGVLSAVAGLPIDLRALEVAVPTGMGAADFLAALDRVHQDVPVFVEVPRDGRGPGFVAALARTSHRAKFRTGGVTADLYPDPAELAAAITAAVDAGVAFKATAGLHHAVRGTDPETGFDQHGFLNLLLAADTALRHRPTAEVARTLADRDAAAVAARVAALDGAGAAAARAAFVSFGTCSVTDPLTELVGLGLIPATAGGEDA
ncbi:MULTISPECIES: hypothetical protein [Thermomonosporaceae]|uniref:hypothetical protein n=1 Tax=Thermomonosporaceae TaxID=2012 RepID=UPI00255B1714|nr:MULTISPECIES: hypothetical protein [Thermomonosporaceae]MDL4773836.1 hypothetical protein [Actinomadura xylanilytica]